MTGRRQAAAGGGGGGGGGRGCRRRGAAWRIAPAVRCMCKPPHAPAGWCRERHRPPCPCGWPSRQCCCLNTLSSDPKADAPCGGGPERADGPSAALEGCGELPDAAGTAAQTQMRCATVMRFGGSPHLVGGRVGGGAATGAKCAATTAVIKPSQARAWLPSIPPLTHLEWIIGKSGYNRLPTRVRTAGSMEEARAAAAANALAARQAAGQVPWDVA